jgi:hypothetical protein
MAALAGRIRIVIEASELEDEVEPASASHRRDGGVTDG